MEKHQPLYRPQVLKEQSADWLGTVVLTTPPATRFFGVVAVLVIAALVALLVFGSFTNKVRVSGWLVPESGMARVFAPIAGTVTELNVEEGTQVKAGAILLTVSTELRSASLGATQAEIGRLLDARRASLRAEVGQQRGLLRQQRDSLSARMDAMKGEITQLGREASVQASRADLARSAADRLITLQEQGYVSLAQVQQQQELALEQAGKAATIRREQAERRRELAALRADYLELPLRSQTILASLEREIAQVDQDQALTESRREFVLTAPQDGTVTAVQVEVGGSADPAVPLITIMPDGARLEAQLFGSSRAVGFVRDGLPVRLRFAAYPYQKFGHHEGTILTVSRAGISPVDLPREMSGLSELFGSTEPVYPMRVALDRQSITAYGANYGLQPGMRLEADILLEKRRLYEWVLDPLYSLTGRL